MRDNNFVYYPGDVVRLPYLSSALKFRIYRMECNRGESCPLDHSHRIVYLPYHSVLILLTIDECKELHLTTRKAVDRLFQLKHDRYFSVENNG